MNSETEMLKIIPQSASGNKNAIFFAVSNEYVFAAANLIMGLNRHSEEMMKNTDIIIYHKDISDKNAELLRSLHQSLFFMPIYFPKEWEEILSHPKTVKWGEFVICKFYGFELIRKYEKVLHLDADMHILADISELFQLEEEIAWRSITGWDCELAFSEICSSEKPVKCGNGGLLVFTDKLNKYHIDKNEIKDTFFEIKALEKGGIDETVIALIVYKNAIRLKELDIRIYNTPPKRETSETRLVHFLNSGSASSKPWKSLASYLYYDEWAENYQMWLDMGGEGPVSFSKEDYYQLFAYEKQKKNKKLSRQLERLKKENEEQKRSLREQNKKISSLRKNNKML